MSENQGQRLVTQKEFYDDLNEKVFVPHLGEELDFSTIRDIVHGIGDVITKIVHEGESVRFGKLGTFKSHITPAGPRWDPTRKQRFDGGERKKVAFKQSKSTKSLLSK